VSESRQGERHIRDHKPSPINPLPATYEANYRLLICLTAAPESIPQYARLFGEDGMGLKVEVVERCRYTTTLELTHCFQMTDHYLTDPAMKVRIYHDARLVEVLGCRNQHRFHAIRPFMKSNTPFLTQKRQVNAFLKEWLSYCLQQRYRLGDEACSKPL